MQVVALATRFMDAREKYIYSYQRHIVHHRINKARVFRPHSAGRTGQTKLEKNDLIPRRSQKKKCEEHIYSARRSIIDSFWLSSLPSEATQAAN